MLISPPKYSGKESDDFSFESGMDRQILSFMHLLEHKYVSTPYDSKPFDLAEKTQFFALDAIGDISLGAPFGYLASDEDLFDYNGINASSLPVMNAVAVLPWLTRIVHQWPMRLALPREGDRVGFGRLMRYIFTLVCSFPPDLLLIVTTKSLASYYVDQRLDSNTAPVEDMLQRHINSGMDRNELIQQVLIFLYVFPRLPSHDSHTRPDKELPLASPAPTRPRMPCA